MLKRMAVFLPLLLVVSVHAQDKKPTYTGSSSGWINCRVIEGGGVFLPVKINGHASMAQLYGGPSNVDAKLASSLGFFADGSSARTMELELGHLALHQFKAEDADLTRPSKIVGQSTPLRLGEELFQQFVVEIDFSHQRIAFHNAGDVTKPKGAVEVPITEINGEWVVPVSVDDASPAQFELELGNVSGPLLVSPAYAKEHQLLKDARTSQRLSGPFIETVVSVNELGFAKVKMPAAPIALIPESQIPPPSIAGGVGLPLLGRFDLVIDYPHKRIYATRRKATASAVFFKDRLGLVVDQEKDEAFVAKFVSPGSPAAGAGFKIGDRIVSINGKRAKDLPFLAMATLRYAKAGETFTLTMDDGSRREVVAADFF